MHVGLNWFLWLLHKEISLCVPKPNFVGLLPQLDRSQNRDFSSEKRWSSWFEVEAVPSGMGRGGGHLGVCAGVVRI